ncbi:hypothetical protein GCM10007108_09240 [Thermogymnomonas acidicola]|uniref:Uncharacterized protein n=1 Tax=Thermogymnomonas acidicola TaxID=399579 RepID=A0AA37BR74_9ARCH|nr:hypothetical protein [Thermogymnomonas acidicola]GGM73378.1 hypothetical protein GCM10007108_09240 [Thermogymnomonas acidicola]
MRRIGIYTSDFRFYHNIIVELKKWGLPFVSLENPNDIPPDVAVVLTSETDVETFPVQVRDSRPDSAVRKAIPYLLNKTHFKRITVGIDPGPYPGLAVMGESILLEATECPSIQSLRVQLESIVSSYSYREIVINVGNGDLPNRAEITSMLERMGLDFRIVDERKTSVPHKMHDNALSAARIARIDGDSYSFQEIKGVRKRDLIEVEFKTLKKSI